MQREIVSRESWLESRKDLVEAEKELTRRSDEVAEQRRKLPCVRIDKAYEFDAESGKASLAELFQGRGMLPLNRSITMRVY